LFVSYTCEHDKAEQSGKFDSLCLICSITIFIGILFTVKTRLALKQSKIFKVAFNLQSVTAGDYTVEVRLDNGFYDDWYENKYLKKYKDDHKTSVAMELKKQLKKDINKIIKAER
jgi:hypothetical protein